MGSNLAFIAFDTAPDLAAVPGLLDYRVYRREDRSEWYLSTPTPSHSDYVIFGALNVDRAKFGVYWTDAVAEYNALTAELKRQRRDTFGLDYRLIPVALALSSALKTRLLIVSGNDEDLDCAFICARGRLVRGRFLTGEAEAMSFDVEQGARLVKLDWTNGHRLYEEAAGVAADFFKAPDAESYAASWERLRADQYKLVAERLGLAQAKRANARLGCVTLVVGIVALLITMRFAPSVGNPMAGVAAALAFIWLLWPVRPR